MLTITHIHIYRAPAECLMGECTFSDGSKKCIEWGDQQTRKDILQYVTSATIIEDDRIKNTERKPKIQ